MASVSALIELVEHVLDLQGKTPDVEDILQQLKPSSSPSSTTSCDAVATSQAIFGRVVWIGSLAKDGTFPVGLVTFVDVAEAALEVAILRTVPAVERVQATLPFADALQDKDFRSITLKHLTDRSGFKICGRTYNGKDLAVLFLKLVGHFHAEDRLDRQLLNDQHDWLLDNLKLSSLRSRSRVVQSAAEPRKAAAAPKQPAAQPVKATARPKKRPSADQQKEGAKKPRTAAPSPAPSVPPNDATPVRAPKPALRVKVLKPQAATPPRVSDAGREADKEPATLRSELPSAFDHQTPTNDDILPPSPGHFGSHGQDGSDSDDFDGGLSVSKPKLLQGSRRAKARRAAIDDDSEDDGMEKRDADGLSAGAALVRGASSTQASTKAAAAVTPNPASAHRLGSSSCSGSGGIADLMGDAGVRPRQPSETGSDAFRPTAASRPASVSGLTSLKKSHTANAVRKAINKMNKTPSLAEKQQKTKNTFLGKESSSPKRKKTHTTAANNSANLDEPETGDATLASRIAKERQPSANLLLEGNFPPPSAVGSAKPNGKGTNDALMRQAEARRTQQLAKGRHQQQQERKRLTIQEDAIQAPVNRLKFNAQLAIKQRQESEAQRRASEAGVHRAANGSSPQLPRTTSAPNQPFRAFPSESPSRSARADAGPSHGGPLPWVPRTHGPLGGSGVLSKGRSLPNGLGSSISPPRLDSMEVDDHGAAWDDGGDDAGDYPDPPDDGYGSRDLGAAGDLPGSSSAGLHDASDRQPSASLASLFDAPHASGDLNQRWRSWSGRPVHGSTRPAAAPDLPSGDDHRPLPGPPPLPHDGRPSPFVSLSPGQPHRPSPAAPPVNARDDPEAEAHAREADAFVAGVLESTQDFMPSETLARIEHGNVPHFHGAHGAHDAPAHEQHQVPSWSAFAQSAGHGTDTCSAQVASRDADASGAEVAAAGQKKSAFSKQRKFGGPSRRAQAIPAARPPAPSPLPAAQPSATSPLAPGNLTQSQRVQAMHASQVPTPGPLPPDVPSARAAVSAEQARCLPHHSHAADALPPRPSSHDGLAHEQRGASNSGRHAPIAGGDTSAGGADKGAPAAKKSAFSKQRKFGGPSRRAAAIPASQPSTANPLLPDNPPAPTAVPAEQAHCAPHHALATDVLPSPPSSRNDPAHERHRAPVGGPVAQVARSEAHRADAGDTMSPSPSAYVGGAREQSGTAAGQQFEQAARSETHHTRAADVLPPPQRSHDDLAREQRGRPAGQPAQAANHDASGAEVRAPEPKKSAFSKQRKFGGPSRRATLASQASTPTTIPPGDLKAPVAGFTEQTGSALRQTSAPDVRSPHHAPQRDAANSMPPPPPRRPHAVDVLPTRPIKPELASGAAAHESGMDAADLQGARHSSISRGVGGAVQTSMPPPSSTPRRSEGVTGAGRGDRGVPNQSSSRLQDTERQPLDPRRRQATPPPAETLRSPLPDSLPCATAAATAGDARAAFSSVPSDTRPADSAPDGNLPSPSSHGGPAYAPHGVHVVDNGTRASLQGHGNVAATEGLGSIDALHGAIIETSLGVDTSETAPPLGVNDRARHVRSNTGAGSSHDAEAPLLPTTSIHAMVNEQPGRNPPSTEARGVGAREVKRVHEFWTAFPLRYQEPSYSDARQGEEDPRWRDLPPSPPTPAPLGLPFPHASVGQPPLPISKAAAQHARDSSVFRITDQDIAADPDGHAQYVFSCVNDNFFYKTYSQEAGYLFDLHNDEVAARWVGGPRPPGDLDDCPEDRPSDPIMTRLLADPLLRGDD